MGLGVWMREGGTEPIWSLKGTQQRGVRNMKEHVAGFPAPKLVFQHGFRVSSKDGDFKIATKFCTSI